MRFRLAFFVLVLSATMSLAIAPPVEAASSGVTVAGGNGKGSAANQLRFPEGLHVDSAGNLYVADLLNHRVQMWAPGATSGVTVAGGNGQGAAANQFNHPYGVAVDSAGNVYVVTRGAGRPQKNGRE